MDDGIPKGVIGAIFSKFKKLQNFLDFCFHRTERKKGKIGRRNFVNGVLFSSL